MNNKLEELFDIEAAIVKFLDCIKYKPSGLSARYVGDILKAATAGREYQLVPEVRDWDGVEPLAVGMRVMCSDGINTVRVAEPDSDGMIVLQNSDGEYDIFDRSQGGMKPIPEPAPKKINHSSLVGSGIDCKYGGVPSFIKPCYTDECLTSIRLNHPMVLTSKQIKAIPDGYKFDAFICNGMSCWMVTVTGIKDGYEL